MPLIRVPFTILVALIVAPLLIAGHSYWERSLSASEPSVFTEPDRIAYRFSVAIKPAEGQATSVFAATQAQCLTLGFDACEILQSHPVSDQSPNAALKLRIARENLELIMNAARQQQTGGSKESGKNTAAQRAERWILDITFVSDSSSDTNGKWN